MISLARELYIFLIFLKFTFKILALLNLMYSVYLPSNSLILVLMFIISFLLIYLASNDLTFWVVCLLLLFSHWVMFDSFVTPRTIACLSPLSMWLFYLDPRVQCFMTVGGGWEEWAWRQSGTIVALGKSNRYFLLPL